MQTIIQFSPVSIIPPLLHTHSFIYHTRCIMFFSQYFRFPCQYHSTIAPYPFIYLPPTLYNIFLPVLQFPLSVSFHQCSIPIHPSTTHTVYYFSPSTSVSPVSIFPPLLHTRHHLDAVLKRMANRRRLGTFQKPTNGLSQIVKPIASELSHFMFVALR